MNSRRILGFVLLAIGILVFAVGLNASNSLTDQVSNAFLGRFTEATTWYMIGGIASALVGLLLLLTGSRRNRA
jgi:LPXTG-motif cell wall-anchored protein